MISFIYSLKFMKQNATVLTTINKTGKFTKPQNKTLQPNTGQNGTERNCFISIPFQCFRFGLSI